MILKNLTRSGTDYHADLVDVEHDRIIPVIIAKGGGPCDWTAVDVANPQSMWEISFVGANKPDPAEWRDGDRIELGCAIQ